MKVEVTRATNYCKKGDYVPNHFNKGMCDVCHM